MPMGVGVTEDGVCDGAVGGIVAAVGEVQH